MKNTIMRTLPVLIVLASAAGISAEESSSLVQETFSKDATDFTFSIAGPVSAVVFYRYQMIYREAFRRLGYSFSLEVFPPERSLAESNAGRVDGEAARMHDLRLYPNLMRVEETIAELSIVASATNPGLKIGGWESLREKRYRVGYRQGIKLLEQKVPQYVDMRDITEVNKLEQACRMLGSGRLDLLIHFPAALEPLLNTEEFKKLSIKQVGVLEKMPLYPYLHTKHRALAPRLAETLRTMKVDGTFQAIIGQVSQETGEPSD